MSGSGKGGNGDPEAPVLETRRLVLRRISTRDADFILGLLNEPSFIRNIGDRGVRTRDAACAYISERLAPSYAAHGYGLYLVEEREPRVPVGICGFVKREALEHADIGFAFLERFWSRGYAHESASAVLEHGRSDLGFGRVLGITTEGNGASARLLEKLGLRFEGSVQLPGLEDPRRLYSLDFGVPARP